MNLLFIGIIGIVILLVVILFVASYIKCPPDMVYMISGLKRKPRIVIGKATLRIPFLERVDKKSNIRIFV